MFGNIIINLFWNKTVKQHMKEVGSYFTNTDEREKFCTRDHFKVFHGRKQLIKFMMLHVNITMLRSKS